MAEGRMLKEKIKSEENVLKAFKKMGFDFSETIKDKKLKDYYSGFSWYLLPHARVGHVLYSVPSKERLKTLPWESWYIDAGERTHHVHYANKRNDHDFDWIQKEWTPERPDEVIGDVWYWCDEPDLTPVLFTDKYR